MKRILVFITLSFICSTFASANTDVCVWTSKNNECKRGGLPSPFCIDKFSTDGYRWGNGTVDSAKDCMIVIQANLLSLPALYKNGDNVTYLNKNGRVEKCEITQRQPVPSRLPKLFVVTMMEALDSPPRASVKDLYSFEEFLDQHIQLKCEF
jgi:hypothetical protein